MAASTAAEETGAHPRALAPASLADETSMTSPDLGFSRGGNLVPMPVLASPVSLSLKGRGMTFGGC